MVLNFPCSVMSPVTASVILCATYLSFLLAQTTWPPIVIPPDQSLKAFYFTHDAIWVYNRTTKGPRLRCQVDLVHSWNSSHIWFKRMFLLPPYSIRNKTIEELLGEIVDWQREPGGTIMMVGFAGPLPFVPFQSEQVLYRDVTSLCAVFLVNPMSPYTKNPYYSCELRVRGNTTIKPSDNCTMNYIQLCRPRHWEPVVYKPYCRNMLKNLGPN